MAKRGKGQPKKIESPEKMWEYFQQYADEKKNNPKYDNKANLKTGEIIPVPRELPLSWNGFSVWLFMNGIACSISHYRYNLNNGYNDFLAIVQTIDHIIYEDKFSGASAGVYNSSIIARDLGLVDKQEVSAKVKSEVSDLTDEQIEERLKKLKNFPDKEDE